MKHWQLFLFMETKPMNQKTERDIVLYYLNNLLKRPLYGDIEERICHWFEKNSRWLIGKDIEEDWENRRNRWKKKDERQPLPRECQTIRKLLNGRTGRLPKMLEVSAIVESFHLSPEYYEVIELDILIERILILNDLTETRCDHAEKRRLKAGMLDLSPSHYEKFLAMAGRA